MILLAPDKFKGTLDSAQASRAMIRGLRRVLPSELCDFHSIVMADGGEGTPQALGARLPYPDCPYYIFDTPDGEAALVMSCQWAGAAMAETTRPARRSTRALGEVVATALRELPGHVYIGVGGTMVADAGRGMLEALRDFSPEILRQRLTGLCDVSCPLLPSRPGQLSAMSFLAQKGYTASDMHQIESLFRHSLAEAGGHGGRFDSAGGGIGFALGTALGARCLSGAQFIAGRHEALFSRAFLVLTGEGCIDSQTSGGKAVEAVADLARKHGCRVVAFGGKVRQIPPGLECVACSPADSRVPRDETAAAQALTDAVEKWARTCRPPQTL